MPFALLHRLTIRQSSERDIHAEGHIHYPGWPAISAGCRSDQEDATWISTFYQPNPILDANEEEQP